MCPHTHSHVLKKHRNSNIDFFSIYCLPTVSKEKREQGHPEDRQEISTDSYRGEIFFYK